ncbi:hypothetical protein ACNSOS_01010 [Aliarcobacter vitoriensis]|uniref:hypothetical protein n=1 Tax=Aliarcobacter vitoriensis TaxID=2011099 RepID=UPI003AAFA9F6
MVRKIIIKILEPDWYIEDRELLEKGEYKGDEYYAHFDVLDEKITYLHDCISVKIDDKIKEDKRFLEVCEFIYLVDDKEQKRFTGTFIDALEFIKKEGSFYG